MAAAPPDDDDDDAVAVDIFQEPAGYYPPEKEATFASHQLLRGGELTVRLVGHNPLWGHYLWNAGRTLSHYIEEHAAHLVKDNTVLELGAGAGLPSLVCHINGAACVVATDYPDADLIDNLRHNIAHSPLLPPHRIAAEGYIWGAPVQHLIRHVPGSAGFDVLILADLLFNHSEHTKLIKSVQMTLNKSPVSRAYVFFTPYRPWLLQKDLAFFDLARVSGFHVTKIFEKAMDRVMFEEDAGDELLRRTVYGYSLSWADCD